MSYNPNEIYQALIKAGEEYADTKAAYMVLDNLTKTYLADAYEATFGSSATERKIVVYGHIIYTEHLDQLSHARLAFLHAEVRYKSMQALADARRTEASTRRAEAKYVGMQEG